MTSLLKKYVFKKNIKDNQHVYLAEDYDKSYDISRRVLSWVAIRMTHSISDFTTKWWDMFYWFEFINISVVIVLEALGISSMVREAQGFQDTVKVFGMIPCFGCVILAVVKSIKMVWNRPVFENLAQELRGMWPRGEISEEEHHIISSSLDQLNFVVKGYYWCNIALLTSYLSPPFFLQVCSYLGYQVRAYLHFLYWLPFDSYQPGVFEFMLVLQTWHALVVIFCNLAWDMLFCTFLSHITTQFDMVARRVRRLFTVKVDQQLIASYPLAVMGRYRDLDTDDTELRHQKELADIILRHHALIRLAGDVENMFSFALLVNFMYSSIIICFCGFCCVLVEKWNDIAYKSFLLTSLSQTWLLCWYGQKLLDSSLGVAKALYECGWYCGSKRTKSSVLIMLHRSQKGVHVTTYGFSPISLASYGMIMKTAWSYFTLLLNVYNKVDNVD